MSCELGYEGSVATNELRMSLSLALRVVQIACGARHSGASTGSEPIAARCRKNVGAIPLARSQRSGRTTWTPSGRINSTVPAPAKVPTTAPGKIGPAAASMVLAGRDLESRVPAHP